MATSARRSRAGLAAGRHVRVCARSTGRLGPLGELGAEVKYLDAALPKQLPQIMSGMRGGLCLYSVPPIGSIPPGDGPRKAIQAAAGAGIGCFVHLSSSGLYGHDPTTRRGSTTRPRSTCTTPRWLGSAPTRTRCRRRPTPSARSSCGWRRSTARAAACARLRKGDYRLLDGGDHAISRLRVDDAVR
ncbi:MAG: hypothetical protein IPH44_41220 [Myxococcales bacterium]|nr:hypothetical protein [Myxococcales bacterium]